MNRMVLKRILNDGKRNVRKMLKEKIFKNKSPLIRLIRIDKKIGKGADRFFNKPGNGKTGAYPLSEFKRKGITGSKAKRIFSGVKPSSFLKYPKIISELAEHMGRKWRSS
jgi:hypothetical protein